MSEVGKKEAGCDVLFSGSSGHSWRCTGERMVAAAPARDRLQVTLIHIMDSEGAHEAPLCQSLEVNVCCGWG